MDGFGEGCINSPKLFTKCVHVLMFTFLEKGSVAFVWFTMGHVTQVILDCSWGLFSHRNKTGKALQSREGLELEGQRDCVGLSLGHAGA